MTTGGKSNFPNSTRRTKLNFEKGSIGGVPPAVLSHPGRSWSPVNRQYSKTIEIGNGTAAVAGTALSCRVVGSGLRVTAEKPLHGQHGFGIMAARRQACGCGCGAESMPPATLPDRRRSARVESGPKERRNRVAVRVHTRTHVRRPSQWRNIRAQKFTSREHRARGRSARKDTSFSCSFRFREQPARVKSKPESRFLRVINPELSMTSERLPDFRFPE